VIQRIKPHCELFDESFHLILANMRFSEFTPFLLTLFLAATATAAPQVGNPDCIVPQVIFETLPKTFSIAALYEGPQTSPEFQDRIPVRVIGRSVFDRLSIIPIISNARIAPTIFNLTDGRLRIVGNGQEAVLQPTIEIFPPVLQGFEFVDPSSAGSLTFAASYACESTGDIFVRLQVLGGPFAVQKISEGQQVFIEPEFFAGEAVNVALQVQGGGGVLN
jgi:hypothetical protein